MDSIFSQALKLWLAIITATFYMQLPSLSLLNHEECKCIHIFIDQGEGFLMGEHVLEIPCPFCNQILSY